MKRRDIGSREHIVEARPVGVALEVIIVREGWSGEVIRVRCISLSH